MMRNHDTALLLIAVIAIAVCVTVWLILSYLNAREERKFESEREKRFHELQMQFGMCVGYAENESTHSKVA